MDPTKRTLLRVTPEEFKELQDEWFDKLMGDDVAPRTEFIQKNYYQAKMIDV